MNQRVMVIIIIILVLVLGIMIGLYISKVKTVQTQPIPPQPAVQPAPTAPPVTTTEPQPITTPTIAPQNNPLVYTNSDFGFKLTFPTGWEKYKVVVKKLSPTEEYYSIYVMLPTKEKGITEEGLAGYQSLFAIGAWGLTFWNSEKAACVSEPNPGCPNEAGVLGKNSKYVFDYSTPNGVPAPDLEKIRNTVNKDFMKNIFKLLD